MANFLDGIWNALKHPVDEAKWMFDTTKDVIKGDMDLKDIPGSHQDMMNDITVPLLGDNKIAKNSDALVGAAVASALAAPAIGGAMGSSGSSFSIGSIGDYFKPSTAGQQWGKLWEASGGAQAWDNMAGPSDDVLGMMADQEAGGAVGTGKEAIAKAKDALPNKMDFAKMSKVLQSINDANAPEPIEKARHRPTGGRFDPNLYKNPHFEREFKQMYSSPLYKDLV
ncbi:MAG: hypothetical protein ACRDC4_12240 [Plesiomonas sp.]